MQADPDSPPAFAWEQWYGARGGRTIAIDEVDDILRAIREEQEPRFGGPVAASRTELGDPAQAAARVKQKARELGADLVGICALEPTDLYRGRTVEHGLAIALGKAMRYEAFVEVPSRASAIECVRIYHALGEVVIGLAAWIREQGWPCRVEHPIGDSDVQHVPLAIRAGFGELGRHGSVIHPEFGPLFRMGSVLTDLPLALDAPLDAGIGAFCDSCRACRIYCPADAIPDERDASHGVDPQGNARYVVDTGKCFAYFAEHQYCSACLPACVYAHKTWARDRDGERLPYPSVAFREPPTPVDAVAPEKRHDYPRFARDGFVPEWKLRARRR